MQRAYGIGGAQISRTTYTQINDGHAVPTKAIQPGTVSSRGLPARARVETFIGGSLVVRVPRPGRVVEMAELSSRRTILAVRRIT